MSPKLDKQLTCRKCKTVIPWADCNHSMLIDCRKCRQGQRVEAFPALFSGPKKGQAAEALLSEDDASCFFHEKKKADAVCDGCGRFLCRLCSIELADMTTCSGCLETGRKSGKKLELMSRATRYDILSYMWSIAAAVLAVIVGMIAISASRDEAFYFLIFWAVFGVVAGAVSLYYALRYRKKPLSLLPVSGWRFNAGLIVSAMSLLVLISSSVLTWLEL